VAVRYAGQGSTLTYIPDGH